MHAIAIDAIVVQYCGMAWEQATEWWGGRGRGRRSSVVGWCVVCRVLRWSGGLLYSRLLLQQYTRTAPEYFCTLSSVTVGCDDWHWLQRTVLIFQCQQ